MTHIGGSADKHETKLIQHLGIVAGICKESRLAELIDERVKQPKRHVTVGQATVAMIPNALGLSTTPAVFTSPSITSASKRSSPNRGPSWRQWHERGYPHIHRIHKERRKEPEEERNDYG